MTRRGSPRSPTQPVMRRSISAGRASSTGMSKIHDWAAAVVGASCRAATGDTLLRAYAVAPMPSVALDARDAHVPPLRGWGRYVHELLTALRAIGAPVRALEGPWPGPEVVWEQLGLPWHALRRRAGV